MGSASAVCEEEGWFNAFMLRLSRAELSDDKKQISFIKDRRSLRST